MKKRILVVIIALLAAMLFTGCADVAHVTFTNPDEHVITYIEKGAVEGVTELVNNLMVQAIGSDKNDE